MCRNLGNIERAKKFEDPTSSAWLLQDSLEKDGFISIERFASWWVMENCVDDAVRWCKDTFGKESSLFEQHGGVNITVALPKFKNMRLSEIFRVLTNSKPSRVDAIGQRTRWKSTQVAQLKRRNM